MQVQSFNGMVFFPTGSEILYLLYPHLIPAETFVMNTGCSRMCEVSRGQSWMVVSPLMYQGLFD